MSEEEDFKVMVRDLMKSPETIQKELTSFDCALIHIQMGLGTESGELQDAIKKHTIYRKPLDLDNVIEELGDLEFYMEDLRSRLGISREETLTYCINKLKEKRYKNGYSDQAAIDRADKDD